MAHTHLRRSAAFPVFVGWASVGVSHHIAHRLLTRLPDDQRIGSIRRLPPDPGEQVGVGVGSQCDRGVPEHLGHQRDVGTGREQHRGAPMAEVVQADTAQPRRVDQLDEALGDPLRVNGVTDGLGEHQPMVPIGDTRLPLLVVLSQSMRQQGSHRCFAKVNAPRLVLMAAGL